MLETNVSPAVHFVVRDIEGKLLAATEPALLVSIFSVE